jgi:phosphoserine phosphatase
MSRSPEREPDEFLQELARDLMQAIGKSLNQSEQVQRIVDRIETEGYQVAVVLAALTRLVARDEHPQDAPAFAASRVEGETHAAETVVPALDPAAFDRDFLRSAGIKGDLPA